VEHQLLSPQVPRRRRGLLLIRLASSGRPATSVPCFKKRWRSIHTDVQYIHKRT
jgi:hypothetical protein